MQGELALLDGSYGLFACMDGRITADLERMYRRGWTLFRTAGGFLDQETRETPEMEEAVREQRNWVVLSHRDCGAAKVVEDAVGDRHAVPDEVYSALVEPLRQHGCCSRVDVEGKSPKVVEEELQGMCGELGLPKKNIITGCLDISDSSHPHGGLRLVITSPLRCSYAELGLDPSDRKTYCLHNNLYATQKDIWIAVKRVGVESIQVRSQNAGEDQAVRRFVDYLKTDASIRTLNVRVEDPVLASNRIWNTYAPQAPQRAPAREPRNRETL